MNTTKKTLPKLMPSQPMPLDDVFHFIAQGAVNIAEGDTTVEARSRVHRAMEDICYYVQAEPSQLIAWLKSERR